MKAVQMTEQGGPEVLRLTELPVPAPGPATSTPSAAAPDRPAWQRNSVRSTSTPTSCGWPRAAEQQRATPVVFSTDSELKARRKRPRAEGARTPPPAHLAGRRASPPDPRRRLPALRGHTVHRSRPVHPGTTQEGILADLKRFYFDTALSPTPYALPALLALAEPGHILLRQRLSLRRGKVRHAVRPGPRHLRPLGTRTTRGRQSGQRRSALPPARLRVNCSGFP
jgi:hypothetical protein